MEVHIGTSVQCFLHLPVLFTNAKLRLNAAD